MNTVLFSKTVYHTPPPFSSPFAALKREVNRSLSRFHLDHLWTLCRNLISPLPFHRLVIPVLKKVFILRYSYRRVEKPAKQEEVVTYIVLLKSPPIGAANPISSWSTASYMLLDYALVVTLEMLTKKSRRTWGVSPLSSGI